MTTAPTYASQRDQMNRSMAGQAPAKLLNGLAVAAERLDAVDFAGRAPRPGDQAPDFTLPDHNGDQVRLSALLRGGSVVLVFYRGAWCPYCNLQLRTFQAHLGQLEEHAAQLVAISPQTPDHSLSMAEKNELSFRVLSDLGGAVIDRYGLRYEVDGDLRALLESVGHDIGADNGDSRWLLPAPVQDVLARAQGKAQRRVVGLRCNLTRAIANPRPAAVVHCRPHRPADGRGRIAAGGTKSSVGGAVQQTQHGGAQRDMGDAPPSAHLRRRPPPDQAQRGQPRAVLSDDESPTIEQPELPLSSRCIGRDELDPAMSGIDGRPHRNGARCHEPEETVSTPELDRHPAADHRDHYGARQHWCHRAAGECLRRRNHHEEQQRCCGHSLGQPENHDSDPGEP